MFITGCSVISTDFSIFVSNTLSSPETFRFICSCKSSGFYVNCSYLEHRPSTAFVNLSVFSVIGPILFSSPRVETTSCSVNSIYFSTICSLHFSSEVTLIINCSLNSTVFFSAIATITFSSSGTLVILQENNSD